MTVLRRVNLNLLPVLRALLRRANVTHAARELNMSQPAVSDALARLRLILHDELLIPSGRSFVLSAMAQRLQPQVEEALIRIEALLAPSNFDPAQSKGKIKIATSDYVGLVIGPPLTKALSEQAPGLSFELFDTHLDSEIDLRMGEIDMMIAVAGQYTDDLGQFRSVDLFEDELVYLVGTKDGVPRVFPGENLELRPHVFYQPRGRPGFMAIAETMLRQKHATIGEAARVPSFLLIPFMVDGTDNVALLQRRVVDRIIPLTQTAAIAPLQPFPKVRIVALWNRARDQEPVHAWFRSVLCGIQLGEDA